MSINGIYHNFLTVFSVSGLKVRVKIISAPVCRYKPQPVRFYLFHNFVFIFEDGAGRHKALTLDSG